MSQNKRDMEQVMAECAKVEHMANSEGWAIIKGYLDNTIKVCNEKWLYMDKDDEKLEAVRQEAARCHAMISLVENFKTEGKRLWNLWTRLEGLVPDSMVDESPNVEDED